MSKQLMTAACFSLAAFAGAAQADTLVAIAGPMTGQYASYGDQIRKGAEMAIADINAKGGVLGQKLKLEIGDDACDPKQAVSVANTMVNKKIAFMHGHFCSGSTIPASEVYNEAQIPMATVSTNPKVTERGMRNIFRIMGRDDQQGLIAAGYIADKFPGKKVAVVDDKSAYGKGLADQIAKVLEVARKQKPAVRESITAGEKDYSGLISKLKAAGVEVLAFGGYHTELALILRQAQQAGLKLTVMGGDTLSTPELVTAAGNADNVLYTFGPDPRKNAGSAEIVKKFRAAKVEPEGYTLYAYAAMELFAQAATQAKSTKYADLEKTLRNGKFQTAVGTLAFDGKGDQTAPGFVVYQWKGKESDYAK